MPGRDIAGSISGRLTAICPGKKNKWGKQLWICECECGNKTEIRTCDFTSGRVKSCGCESKEKLIRRTQKHGLSNTREHKIWRGLHDRCRNQRNRSYPHYGGRGITVCKEWGDFSQFYEDMGPSNGLELDRIDNDKGYSKDNCRWTTRAKNNQNTRKSKRWFVNGRKHDSLSIAAKIHGVDPTTIAYWCRKGIGGAYWEDAHQ